MIDKITMTEQKLTESIELASYLMEKQFPLSGIGLSDKVAFDWTKAGLYLEEKKTTGRRKYNVVEYVWLRLVKDLREFGLSFEALRNLKSFLLQKTVLLDFYIELLETTPEDISDKDLKALQKKLKDAGATTDGMKKEFAAMDGSLMDSLLYILIQETIFTKTNKVLLIKKDGVAMVTVAPVDDNNLLSEFCDSPYITYPLRHILTDFVAREDLIGTPVAEKLVTLSEAEKKVMDLLRQGNLVSLSVRLNNNKIILIETEEEIDIKDAKGKLVDYIKQNSYQEITYKTQRGKIVSMKRKTKHK